MGGKLKNVSMVKLTDRVIVYLFALLPEYIRVIIIKIFVKSKIKGIRHAEKTKGSTIHNMLS